MNPPIPNAGSSVSDRPSIAYVDEHPDERDNFFGDAFDSGLFEHIHLIHPDQDLEVTIATLLELNIDALVTDFNLTDAAPLGYSGERLVERMLEIRSEFPCFIRTSYEEAALDMSADVNRVYSKDMAADEHAGRSIFKRISLQIERHRKQIEQWKNDLQKLLDVAPADRTAADVDAILKLDERLEASVGNDVRIPAAVKETLFSVRDDLLSETEKLVNDMKRALGDPA